MLKRFLFYMLILTLLGGGGDIIRLFAHCVDRNRGYNRMHEFKSPSTNTKYAQCQGSDEEGTMSAYASSSADKDWYFEPNVRRGVEYTASAGCSSSNPEANGYYSVEAYVPNRTPDVKADFFEEVSTQSAYRSNFTPMEHIDNVDIFDELSSCNAGASINGEHPSDGSGSEPPTYQFATAVGNW